MLWSAAIGRSVPVIGADRSRPKSPGALLREGNLPAERPSLGSPRMQKLISNEGSVEDIVATFERLAQLDFFIYGSFMPEVFVARKFLRAV
jgi:hypothetical protein